MALAAKSFSDLITFTRASTAGYYGSDGLYKTAASGVARTGTYADYKPAEITQQNILTYSSDYSQAAWIKTNSFVQTNLLTYSEQFDNVSGWNRLNAPTFSANSTAAPDGTTTADTITDGNAAAFCAISQTTAVANDSSPYTFSIYVLKTTGGTSTTFGVNINLSGGTGVSTQIRLNTDLGTLLGGTTATVDTAGNYWRVSRTVTNNSTGNTSLTIELYPAASGYNGSTDVNTVTGSAVVWGAQLVQGSVAGNYRGTTSAALPILYPDALGTTLAMKVSESTSTSQHYFHQLAATVAGTTYTYSVYAKGGENSTFSIHLPTTGFSGNAGAYSYNLSTGVATNLQPSSTGVGGITAIGDGWYRCWISQVASSTITANSLYIAWSGLSSYAGNGSRGTYFFGAQFNETSILLPYLATTATGAHATTTGAKRGFLVEDSRANLVLQSQTFDNASWTKGVSTISADAATAPDGTTTADKLIVNNTVSLGPANAAGARQLVSKSAVATTYSWSVFAKAGEFNNVYLFVANSGLTASALARFDLSSGTVRGAITVAGSFVGVSATAEPIGGGYFRCTLVATSDTDTTIRADIWPGDSTATTGNGTSGIYAWGAQLEAGDKATTYIPTTTAQVTRAADSARLNTLTPWFSTTGGTFYAEGTNGNYPATLLSMVDAAGYATNSVAVGKLSTAPTRWSEAAVYTTGGNNALQFDTTAASVLKFAFSWDGTNIYAAANGQTTKTAVRPLSLANTSGGVRLGEYFFGNMLNNHLRVVRFYPRVFVGTELSGLTA